jgi:dUTP pyrophosphatase
MCEIKVRRLNSEALLPARSGSDVGWDLYANTVTPLADNMVKVGTGIAIELPEGYWAEICNRSSMGKAGWAVHGGIVDNGYRGEIIVILVQHRIGVLAELAPGMKIAQLIIRRQEDIGWKINECSALSDTKRGADGFGSTGR